VPEATNEQSVGYCRLLWIIAAD